MRSCFYKWYRGQVVRQESAKLSFASSNLAGTSKTKCSRDSVGIFVFGCVAHEAHPGLCADRCGGIRSAFAAAERVELTCK